MSSRARFALRQQLYDGHFSAVFRATDARSGGSVVIKRAVDDVHARHEFRVLEDLRRRDCRNVAGLAVDRLVGDEEIEGARAMNAHRFFRDAALGCHPSSIVSPLYSEHPGFEFDDRGIRLVARDLVLALVDVHAAGYVHCDVKRENVMWDDDAHLFRLIDFGLAEALADRSVERPLRVRGTPAFMAPEVVRREGSTPMSDVYSVGVMLFMLLHGGLHPIPAMNGVRSAHFARIVATRSYDEGEWVNDAAPAARDLCRRLMAFNPLDRPTAREASEHPLLRGL